MSKKKQKRETFTLAEYAIWAVVTTFGVFAAAGWWVRFAEQSVALAAIMVMVSVAAAAMAPLMIPVFEQAKGSGKALAGAVIAVFAIVDATGGHNAFVTFEALAQANRTAAEQRAVDARLAGERAALEVVQQRIARLPTADVACAEVGPVGCQARLAGIAAERQQLTADRQAAQARIDSVDPTAEPVAILDHTMVGVAMVLVQLALVLGVLAITKTRLQLEAERRKQAERRRKRREKATEKPKKKRRAKKAPQPEPQVGIRVVK